MARSSGLKHLFLMVAAFWLLHICLSPSAAFAPAQITLTSERERGIQLLNQRKFKDATRVFRNLANKDKTDSEGWYYLGLSLLQQGNATKNAAKAFETALSLRPDFPAARTGLSYTLLLRNKLPEAMREAQAVLNGHPGIAEAHYIVGVVRLRSGLPDEALREAEEAIKLDPQLASPYLLKSQALLSGYRIRMLTPATIQARPSVPTAEEMIKRRNKRKEGSTLFIKSAASLETYLRLNPHDAGGKAWREQLETLKVFARYGEDTPDPNDTVFSSGEVTTKPRVLSKPEPVYTEEARREIIRGTVVFQVVFAADATVRHFLVLQGLPNGLTAQALKAARRIKFVPATIDRRPVSMFIQLEYNFNLY
jgi:tetratricopeptide (TPR) repeat protein